MRALRERPVPAQLGARAAAGGRRRDAGGLRAGRAVVPAARLHLQRDPAALGVQPRRLPVRRQERLLPAVLGRDGAAAADGRRARARRRPASPPARSTPRRASTWSATSTPTRGSRSGTRGIGWVTFDPTPAAAPPRSQPNEAGASGGPVGEHRPAEPRRRRPAVRPRPARRWRTRGGHAVGLDRGSAGVARARAGRSPRSCCCAGAAAARPRRRRRSCSPSSSARCAAPAAIPARARRCSSLEQRFARSPAAAGYVRAVQRPALRRPAAARRRPRSAAACAPSCPAAPASAGGCGRGGRCPRAPH